VPRPVLRSYRSWSYHHLSCFVTPAVETVPLSGELIIIVSSYIPSPSAFSIFSPSNAFIFFLFALKVHKGKAIPIRAWTDPQSSSSFRRPLSLLRFLLVLFISVVVILLLALPCCHCFLFVLQNSGCLPYAVCYTSVAQFCLFW